MTVYNFKIWERRFWGLAALDIPGIQAMPCGCCCTLLPDLLPWRAAPRGWHVVGQCIAQMDLMYRSGVIVMGSWARCRLLVQI